MENDKPDCENSNVLDSKKEDDIEKCIKAKYKLLLQEQLVVGGKLELDRYPEDDVVKDVKEFYILYRGKQIHPNFEYSVMWQRMFLQFLFLL